MSMYVKFPIWLNVDLTILNRQKMTGRNTENIAKTRTRTERRPKGEDLSQGNRIKLRVDFRMREQGFRLRCEEQKIRTGCIVDRADAHPIPCENEALLFLIP